MSASNAFGSGRRLKSNRVFGTIDRFLDLYPTPLEIAALASVMWAAVRRDLVTLTLAAGAVLWVVIEIAFALHGWPGLGRYMFGAGAVMVVIAAALVGRLLAEIPRWIAGRGQQARPVAPYGWAGVALAAVLVGFLIPPAISIARGTKRGIDYQRARTKEIDRLAGVVTQFGGAGRLNACGEPLTRLEYQTILAWTLHVNVAKVGFKYGEAIRHGNPLVLFTPRPHGGWLVQAVHQRLPSCRGLPS